MKTLKDIQSYLNEIPSINYGGCGVVALILYRFFKNQNRNMEIVLMYTSLGTSNYMINQKVLSPEQEERFNSLVGASHVALEIDGEYCDSTGVCDISNFTRIHTIKETNLLDMVQNKELWNDDFDRSCLSEIEESMGIDLADIK